MAIPMIPFRTVMFSAALGMAASLPAQEPVPPAKPPVEQKQPDAAAKKSPEQLIRELGDDSYRTRLDAERKLRELGDAAVPALREAAAGDDPEVQWRARRVLRQIERGGKDLVERDRAADQGQPGGQGRDERAARARDRMRQQFESLFENFERNFGLDVPRARFFDDDFFKDLQEQMRNLPGTAQGMSVQIGPDGAVRVEVQEKNDKGEPEKKVYEAPDMETFQRQHPGVLRQNGVFFGMKPLDQNWQQNWPDNFRGFVGPTMRDWTFDWNDHLQPRVFRFDRSPATAPLEEHVQPVAPPPAGRRLGVSIRPEISTELREHLGLADDTGMMNEAVEPGSLAEALDLQRGDIVTAIGAQKIGGPEDVQQALGAIEKGKQVDVKFLRKGAEKTATAAKTEDAAPPAKTGVERRPAKAKADETIR